MSKVTITEITTPGCVHCAEAKKIFEGEIKPNFPEVEIEYIDGLSDKGQQLIEAHGIMSSPGILVNGELFAMGGLNKEKLIEKIEELMAKGG